VGRWRVDEVTALTGGVVRDTLEIVGREVTLERFTSALGGALASKDYETREHSARLVGAADAIARRLGLADEVRRVIRFGAYLHDIGKVVIPGDLLRKRGALTPYEVSIVRRHPEVGADILADIETWRDIRLIVRHHHERFDGNGYPDGLRGAHIPLGARIVSVVDALDVMRTGRPYQPARSPEWILEELHRERGSQFDPDVVDELIAITAAPSRHQDSTAARSN